MHPDAIPDFTELGPHGIRPGVSPMRGCTIFAHLLAEKLDEFLIQCLYAAAARRCFDHARLFVFHHKEHAHHQSVPLMLPEITYAWRGDAGTSVPMDFFDPSSKATIRAGSPFWYQQGCDKPDLMLVPSMMNWQHLGAFEQPPRFELPRDRVPDIARAFLGLGVDPNWWFCAIAVPDREATTTPEAFTAALDAVAPVIMKQHGAGLVLVGDPTTNIDRIPPGVVDARHLPEGILGQGYVISKARFLMEPTPSPWLWLAFGFDVPWLRRVDTAAPIQLPGRGGVFPAAADDPEAHATAARAMIRETRDCPIWRSPPKDHHGKARNAFDLPMRVGPDAAVIAL